MKLLNDLIILAKGWGMGAANVIPGVSGGTIALLTGIYQEIVEALAAVSAPSTWKFLFKGDVKGFLGAIHFRFLAALLTGVLISVFTIAKGMEYVLAHYPVQTWGFFFGLIIASAAYMFCGIKAWRAVDVVWAAAGGILGVAVCTLSPTTTPDTLLFVFICGAIAICTMILPGISGSFILVIMGKYEYIMNAIGSLNLPVIAAFGGGCVVGLLAFAKFLKWLLERCERQTMLVLLGFIIGSLVKVWPWSNMEAVEQANIAANTPGDLHIAGAVIWAAVGIALVLALEAGASKK